MSANFDKPEVFLHEEASAEVEAAMAWYRKRSRTAADFFFLEVCRAMEQIAEHPSSWPRHEWGTRRFLLHRFPFSLVYRQIGAKVEILAVAHAKRRPSYWKDRNDSA